MRVLLLGPNYAPEIIGIAVYSEGLCRMLAAEGHEVTVVTAKPHYPGWRIFDGWRGGIASRRRENDVDVTRVALYIPSTPSGLKRILHYLSFAAMAAIPLLMRAISRRPDVVIAVAPSLIAAPLAWLAARLRGARCWLHVQDFEVEAAFATGLMRKDGVAARLAAAFERFVIGRFDGVSSISPEMCRKLIAKGADPSRVYEFRNWADLSAIRPLTGLSPFCDEWAIKTEHVALYSGNLARKQGIELLAATARRLAGRRDLTIVICGEGPGRVFIEEACRDIPNVIIRDLQPFERLSDLLGLASVHLLPQKADAADLVLPSKLTNMLASGRPVIATAAPGTGLQRELEGCGVTTTPGDANAFAAAISDVLDDPAFRARLSGAARARAETAWEKTAVIEQFKARLGQLLG